MEGKRHGPLAFFRGCNSLSQKIFARASSSESLEEGPKATRLAWGPIPAGGTSPAKRTSRLNPGALADDVKRLCSPFRKRAKEKEADGLGTIKGVLIPVMENMWGVLIFLRFYYVVGNAGIWQSYLVVLVSFTCAIITTMSLSAVATNGVIEEGGTYYLISRALGPKLGGTVGIMYYLGVSLLAVLESLGAVEMLEFTFGFLHFPSQTRILALVIILVLGFLVCFGIKFVSKLSVAFFMVVIVTMLLYYIGLVIAPHHKPGQELPSNLTGLQWSTFKGNWGPGYDKGVSWSVALAIFFPCYTGILSGADRAKHLANPEKSLPRGTIGAVTISLLVYLSYMGLWGAVGTRDYLLGRTPDGMKRAEGQNLEVVKDLAPQVVVEYIIQLGIIVASMAQALQCLATSPQLFQAIANDGVIPIRYFAKTSKKGEATRARIFTIALCCAAAMIGSLDAVAPLVSICFLSAYAALNLSCVVMDYNKGPSWRPHWKFYHWTVAAVGTLLCWALSFVIKWYWALACVLIQIILPLVMRYRQVEVDWGSGWGGLRLQLAVRTIIAEAHEARYTVNWRPQLLLLLKPRSALGLEDHSNEELMFLGTQLKKGRGLNVIVTILEGVIQKMNAQAEAERLEIENSMRNLELEGFAKVLVASTYREGKSFAIQSSGLGALEPNTLLLGWPNEWQTAGHYHSADVLLEILDQCKAANKSSVLCMNLKEFPSENAREEGFIDVWWMVHDGGMLILLAHLLQRHKIWRKCKLRVNTISDQIHDTASVEKNLKETLRNLRIEAEAKVFDMATDVLAPYTYDTTIRLQEARQFATEIAKFRLDQKDQQDRAELSRQASSQPQRRESTSMQKEDIEPSKSPPRRGSSSGDRPTLDNVFRGRSADVQASDSSELHTSREEHISIRSSFQNLMNQGLGGRSGKGGSEHQEDSDIPKLSKRKGTTSAEIGRKVENILKKSAPGELSMLEGHQYRPRGARQVFKSLVLGGDMDKGEEIPSSSTSRSAKAVESKEESKGMARPAKAVESKEESKDMAGPAKAVESKEESKGMARPTMESSQRDSSDQKAAAVEEPVQQRAGKETRWAIDIEAEPEIVAVINSRDWTEKAEDGGAQGMVRKDSQGQLQAGMVRKDSQGQLQAGMVRKDSQGQLQAGMVRKDSAGQLYPGSPHNSEFSLAANDVPEVVKRTWETFSQDYSPDELNKKILEQSKDASLVLLNLPDHYEGMEPALYMQYCEKLTQNLRRVLMVSGTGKELWSGM